MTAPAPRHCAAAVLPVLWCDWLEGGGGGDQSLGSGRGAKAWAPAAQAAAFRLELLGRPPRAPRIKVVGKRTRPKGRRRRERATTMSESAAFRIECRPGPPNSDWHSSVKPRGALNAAKANNKYTQVRRALLLACCFLLLRAKASQGQRKKESASFVVRTRPVRRCRPSPKRLQRTQQQQQPAVD